MSEIKYRAWDKQRREYLSGGQILIAVLPGERPKHNPVYLDVLQDADACRGRFILEQFTGLKDKAGVEIYEGDICKFVDLPCGEEELCIGEVIHEEFGWHFTDAITESSLSCYDSGDVEVIGNIHAGGSQDA